MWHQKTIKMHKSYLILFSCLILIVSCNKKSTPIVVNAQDYYNTLDKITRTLVHDIFSPPVASRVYVYPNIAAYEIIVQKDTTYKSLASKISTLGNIPKPETSAVNLNVSALVAYIEVSKKLVFTHELINKFQDSLYNTWKDKNVKEFEISEKYGMQVATHIHNWLKKDNYSETRTMPKFAVDADEVSRWQPTPPSYIDGIEPHWNKIRPLLLTTADQFKPREHPEFSLDRTSNFYKELKEVYDITNSIKEKGEKSEEIRIAQFWDCNPYVAVSTGHLTVATKKITPGGHWMGIATIACKKNQLDFSAVIYAQTYTSIGVFDAFISCWDEKYRSNLIRPETLINKTIDRNWTPLLQTPPFPEYSSGHSVVSGAASVILTHLFQENFSFIDTTELPYGLPSRNFKSFKAAASEAAISRLYGGIHYRAAVENGLSQGENIGEYVCQKLK